MVVVSAALTVNVKGWLKSGGVQLLAVIVKLKLPLAEGVPLSTPALLRVTPPGKVPTVTLKVGMGLPVATTVKLPAAPTVKAVLFALVVAGAGHLFKSADIHG